MCAISDQHKMQFDEFLVSSQECPQEKYTVLRRFTAPDIFNEDQLGDICKLVDTKGFIIFQDEDPALNDSNRKQLNLLSHKAMTDPVFNGQASVISKRISSLFKLTGQRLKRKASVLLSKPGCRRQVFHCDNPTNVSAIKSTNASFICLLALQDDTKLYAINSENVESVIGLQKGDLFIARGSFVHAGGDYLFLNCRFHFYIDSASNKRKADYTNFRYADDLGFHKVQIYDKYYDVLKANGERTKAFLKSRKEKRKNILAKAREYKKSNFY